MTAHTADVEAEGADRPVEEEKKKESFLDFLKELPILIVIAFAIALLIKTFLVQAFYIPSQSMERTLLVKDRVLVMKLWYRFADPKPGDVVVFVSPIEGSLPRVDRGPVGNFLNSLSEGLGLKSSERDFIKRVVATEGQTIQIKDGVTSVDGKKIDEDYRSDQLPMPDYGPLKIPANRVFVMGDNRANSQDSRVFGAIPESSIVGRAFVIIWPPSRISLLRR